MSDRTTTSIIIAALAVCAAMQGYITALERWCEHEQQRIAEPRPQFVAVMARCAQEHAAEAPAFGDRLLGNLDERAQWPATMLTLPPNDPDVVTTLTTADGQPHRLRAWIRHSHGVATALIQLDDDEVYYALTDAEFAELQGQSPASDTPATSNQCLAAFDFEADGDVDLADFASFGPLVAP